MLYTIADTHLSFTTEKPMDIFGARWENHAEKLKQNWLTTVKQTDTVVIPGDISWGISLEEAREDLLFLDSLPGRKIIGKGNHDYFWTTVNKMTSFLDNCGITTISFLYNNAYFADNKIICGTRSWMSEFGIKMEDERIISREAQRLELSLKAGEKLKEEAPDAEIIAFLHYPVVFGDFINYQIIDVLYKYNVTKVYYGHLHNIKENQLDKHYLGIDFHLISADYLNFMPCEVK